MHGVDYWVLTHDTFDKQCVRVFVFNVLNTAKVIWRRTGPQLRVSSNRGARDQIRDRWVER